MQEVHGDYETSFSFSAKPAIQNPNIRLGVFLAKMRGHVQHGRPN